MWRIVRFLLVLLAGVLVAWWFWSGTASAQEEAPTDTVSEVVGTVAQQVERTPAAPVVEIVEPVAAPIVEPVDAATAPVIDRVGAVVQPVADVIPPVPPLPAPPAPPVVEPLVEPLPADGASGTTTLLSPTAAPEVASPDATVDSNSPAAVATVASTTRRPSPVVLTPGSRGGMRGSAAGTDLVATEVSGGGAAGPTGSTTDPVGPASPRPFALPSGSGSVPFEDGLRLLAVLATAAAAAVAASRLRLFALAPVGAGAPRPSFTPD